MATLLKFHADIEDRLALINFRNKCFIPHSHFPAINWLVEPLQYKTTILCLYWPKRNFFWTFFRINIQRNGQLIFLGKGTIGFLWEVTIESQGPLVATVWKPLSYMKWASRPLWHLGSGSRGLHQYQYVVGTGDMDKGSFKENQEREKSGGVDLRMHQNLSFSVHPNHFLSLDMCHKISGVCLRRPVYAGSK